MKLGTQVGLGPGHIELHGNPSPPPQRGIAPNFRPICVADKWLHGSRYALGMEVGLGPGDFVLHGDPVPPSPKRGRSHPPKKKNRPMFIMAKWLGGSRKMVLGTEVAW